MVTIRFTLNGKAVSCEVSATEVLVDTLRVRFGLTGTKKACGTGDCGACTVLLDGTAIRSCIFLAAMADGHSITTIEGVGSIESPHPVQQAVVDAGNGYESFGGKAGCMAGNVKFIIKTGAVKAE